MNENDEKNIKEATDIRDCDNCVHHVTKDGITGCESWECKFEHN